MGARSRRKGARFERELAARLEAAGGGQHAASRNLTECRDGNSGDLVTSLPLCVQAKVGQRPNPWAALREAVEAAGPGQHPVAVLRMNGAGGRPATDAVVLPLDDFCELLEQLVTCGAW